MTYPGLTNEQIIKLARLKNYSTRYELVAYGPNGEKILVCYTPRKSLRGVIDAIRSRWEECERMAGTDQCYTQKRAEDGCKMGAWVIRFSGRTQREAIIDGELRYIGSLD